MKKLKQEFVDVLENREWNVVSYTDDGRVELQWYSPAGEDFGIIVEVENFPFNVEEYYKDFDAEEHAMMWIQAKLENRNRTDIPNLRTLIDDADAIKDELASLQLYLDEVW